VSTATRQHNKAFEGYCPLGQPEAFGNLPLPGQAVESAGSTLIVHVDRSGMR
jgi:hypothetical protein